MRRYHKLCRSVPLFLLAASFFLAQTAVYGQGQSPFAESSVVRQKCGACHKMDPQGRVDVIEATRKTPEEWNHVVERMIRINGAIVDDSEFYVAVKELSKYLCLSPQEMTKIAYINSDENSQYVEKPQDDVQKRLFTTCVRCHTYGKIASHRMTPNNWADIRNLHLGYYPTVVAQMREMDWAKESKELVEILAKLYPFEDPQWQSWMKSRADRDLSGRWVIAGYEPGLGYYEGNYTLKGDSKSGEGEYLIEKEVRYLNGIALKMSGTGTLYGGYHLRYALTSSVTRRIEGVFDLDAPSGTFTGKWWSVVQDANAYGNEKFAKVGDSPASLAVFPQSFKIAGGTAQQATLIGTNLPAGLKEADIRCSDPNVKIRKVEKSDATRLTCTLEVGPNTPPGTVKLSVKGVAGDTVITVYNKVDAIKVFPTIGRARVSSGPAYPPQGVQFVARAVSYGKDAKPDTPDDLILEPVDAQWILEEEKTRENDDDLKILNAPVPNGLYTPFTTYGPIESRQQRKEGTGLIAIVAAYKEGNQELKGRSLLAVTVPDFVTHIK
jgi:quinohemoprotein amine dehydrogenase